MSYAEIDKIQTNYVTRNINNLDCTQAPAEYCEAYVQLFVKSGGRSVQIKRVYGKVFDLLGQLGGFMDILLVIFGVAYILIRCQNDSTKYKKKILGKNFRNNRSSLSEKTTPDYKDETKKKEKQKRLIEIEDEVIEEANDGIKLSQKSLEVDIMNNVIFQDYHRALLPLLYMNQAKKRLEDGKVAKVATQMIKKAISHNTTKIIGKKKETLLEREMKLETAYIFLVDSEPKSELEIRIKDYFLANIPEDFKANHQKKTDLEGNSIAEEHKKSDNYIIVDTYQMRNNKKLLGESDKNNRTNDEDQQNE